MSAFAIRGDLAFNILDMFLDYWNDNWRRLTLHYNEQDDAEAPQNKSKNRKLVSLKPNARRAENVLNNFDNLASAEKGFQCPKLFWETPRS